MGTECGATVAHPISPPRAMSVCHCALEIAVATDKPTGMQRSKTKIKTEKQKKNNGSARARVEK